MPALEFPQNYVQGETIVQTYSALPTPAYEGQRVYVLDKQRAYRRIGGAWKPADLARTWSVTNGGIGNIWPNNHAPVDLGVIPGQGAAIVVSCAFGSNWSASGPGIAAPAWQLFLNGVLADVILYDYESSAVPDAPISFAANFRLALPATDVPLSIRFINSSFGNVPVKWGASSLTLDYGQSV